MSVNSADYSTYYPDYGQAAVAQLQYAPRKRAQPLWFLPGVLIAAASWMGDGVAALTDLSFVVLAVVCVISILEELSNFAKRFGMGGITLFGGVLVWFCHDYFTNWFSLDFTTTVETATPYVLAKSAFLHQLFVFFAVAGLQLPIWRPLERFLGSIPDPQSDNFYVPLILLTFFVGLIPYLFFASDPLPVALWKEIIGGRGGGAGFTVGRDGNVNYSWGAYLAQLQQIGHIGAILALFYVMLLRPSAIMKVVCLSIWLLQVGMAFGSGTRGHTAYMAMPALFVIFLKYQSQAAEMFRRVSMKAYITSALVGLALVIVLQIQITYRNIGFTAIKMEEVRTGIEGNSMFSEGLAGMALIPDHKGFFQNRFPGHGAVVCLPDVTWRFLYGPIPRALWQGKPIDPLWAWYNSVITGRSIEELEGTTVATGLVGDFYFRFGLAGVLEGGLIFGFFCILGERMLQNSQGRLIQLVASIGVLVFVFRCFRGFSFITLYPLIIGLVFLVIVIKLTGARRVEPQWEQ